MKQLKQRWKITVFAVPIILVWLFNNGSRLNFSQNYRKIQGVENIVLERNGWGTLYKRCFWGLKKVGQIPADHQGSYKHFRESDASKYVLENCTAIDNWIRQSIYSPDKKYILYCEIKFGDSGVSDDEYCYYRVYEIETGKIITLYQAYREWYNLSWSD